MLVLKHKSHLLNLRCTIIFLTTCTNRTVAPWRRGSYVHYAEKTCSGSFKSIEFPSGTAKFDISQAGHRLFPPQT